MADQDNKVVVILAGVLLAIVVVAGAVFVLLPGDEAIPAAVTNSSERDVPAPVVSARGFDLTVLQQRSFQLLNRQLILEGALPVQAPAEIGKANPFL